MMQKPRERDFSQTRLSYSRQVPLSTERPTLSPSHRASRYNEHSHKEGKLCMNCYNHQISVDKQTKRALNEEEKTDKGQALTLSKLSRDNAREKDLSKNEALKVNEFNLKKIQENQRKRAEEKEKIKEEKPTQQQIEQMRELEQRKQLDQKRRNKLREDLEKQITFAKQRREQEAQENRSIALYSILDKPQNQRERQLIENAYKQDLIKQINQKRNRKLEDEQVSKSNNQQNQLSFIRNAELKRKEAQMQEASFKEVVRNEIKSKIEASQQKRQAIARQREQENFNRINQERESKELTYQKQNDRRDKIEKYIFDLKKQMQDNAAKRNEEFKWLGLQTDNCILAPRQDPNIEPCTCCKKQVPNRQLSPYIREIKRP